MAVKTRKQGNSITITIPSEFNIPSDEIIFIPEESGHQISYVSDDAFDLNWIQFLMNTMKFSKLWWKNDSIFNGRVN